MNNFDTKFASFFAGVRNIIDTHYKTKFPTLTVPVLRFTEGKRYIKLINGSSAFVFVDKTNGDILKTASWNAPAKGARGNIFDENNGLARITPYGAEYNN